MSQPAASSTRRHIRLCGYYLLLFLGLGYIVSSLFRDVAEGDSVSRVDSTRPGVAYFRPEDLVGAGVPLVTRLRDTADSTVRRLSKQQFEDIRRVLEDPQSTPGQRTDAIVSALNRWLHGPSLPGFLPDSMIGPVATLLWRNRTATSDSVRVNWIALQDIYRKELVPVDYDRRRKGEMGNTVPLMQYETAAGESDREWKILLLVIAFGGLGSTLHGARSIAVRRANNNYKETWDTWYYFEPFLGAALALVFYFVIRGGVTTQSASTSDVNVFAVLGLAGMVGLFSKVALQKLSAAFGSVQVRGSESNTPRVGPSAGISMAPVVATATLMKVPLKPDMYLVAVNGQNFIESSTVVIGTERFTGLFKSASSLSGVIKLVSPALPSGTVDIAVENEVQGKALLSNKTVVKFPPQASLPERLQE